MTDLKISVDNDKPAVQNSENEIKEVLRAEDELRRIKKVREDLITEYKQTDDLIEARKQLGGKSYAGQVVKEKTPLEIADEEAKELLSKIR